MSPKIYSDEWNEEDEAFQETVPEEVEEFPERKGYGVPIGTRIDKDDWDKLKWLRELYSVADMRDVLRLCIHDAWTYRQQGDFRRSVLGRIKALETRLENALAATAEEEEPEAPEDEEGELKELVQALSARVQDLEQKVFQPPTTTMPPSPQPQANEAKENGKRKRKRVRI